MICQYVSSSNLNRVCYDQNVSQLDITFHSGHTYRYFNVPLQVWSNLMSAGSKGTYFDRFIKHVYRCIKIF